MEDGGWQKTIDDITKRHKFPYEKNYRRRSSGWYWGLCPVFVLQTSSCLLSPKEDMPLTVTLDGDSTLVTPVLFEILKKYQTGILTYIQVSRGRFTSNYNQSAFLTISDN
ncbi:hypothetical protein AVEN_140600-1 [Araneus ventricosus]|uniref:Uncharacterized protein n=1 Tax=Araneus ventricosus TaxID=182803 RepID=A0A4Y2GRE4_ARAVE|nr:hypothetical protein AVEN_140600-1 [Araneus ventricosus]